MRAFLFVVSSLSNITSIACLFQGQIALGLWALLVGFVLMGTAFVLSIGVDAVDKYVGEGQQG